MCRIDDVSSADFSFCKTRKARTTHTCAECARTIQPKEQYLYSSWGCDGTAQSNKRCQHCDVGADWLQRHCGGYVYGKIKAELLEHLQEGSREDGLQRILIGMGREWKAFKGKGLLSVLTIQNVIN